jgi:teichuronic acid biosynthesis glycosyltransferase TuaC
VLRPRLARTLQAADRSSPCPIRCAGWRSNSAWPPNKTEVVGNGVDTEALPSNVDRAAARARFGLPDSARVLISVGGLVERKGMHRVIEVMPALLDTPLTCIT